MTQSDSPNRIYLVGVGFHGNYHPPYSSLGVLPDLSFNVSTRGRDLVILRLFPSDTTTVATPTDKLEQVGHSMWWITFSLSGRAYRSLLTATWLCWLFSLVCDVCLSFGVIL